MYMSMKAIEFKQGDRRMFVAVTDPVSVVKVTEWPEEWNPLGKQAHGNRRISKPHREGIVRYLKEVPNFIIGAITLYTKDDDFEFVPDDDAAAGISPGELRLKLSARFDIGDGQHRVAAYTDIIATHKDDGHPSFDRISASGQPIVVVVEDDGLRRAQDFADLQKNVKPPSGSLGMSMDRRVLVNSFVTDLVQTTGLDLFAEGKRVEFLVDSPGKYSQKVMSFKTLRYFAGTMAIGAGSRTAKGWQASVNAAINGAKGKITLDAYREFFDEFEEAYRPLLDGKEKPEEFRARTYLTAASFLYAAGLAAWKLGFPKRPQSIGKKIASVDWERSGNLFVGTLVNPENGKVMSGRVAWEGAADAIYKATKA